MKKRTPAEPELDPAAALDAATARAIEIGYAEHLLCVAREDRAWRERVERALSKRGPLGQMLHGAQPASLWKPETPLHKRIVKRIEGDPEVLVALAMANERIKAVVAEKTDEPETPDFVRERLTLDESVLATWVLFPEDDAAKAAVLGAACDALETARAQGTAECGPDAEPPDPAAAAAAAAGEAPGDSALAALVAAREERIADLESQLREAKATAQQQNRELKDLRKELKTRTGEVSRKDRKQQELRDRAKAAEAERDAAQADARTRRGERDEARRQVAKLEAQVKADRAGRETVEEKREAESGSYLATIGDLREQVRASKDVSVAMEGRVASLEAELEGERARRAELEQAFEAFGFEDMVKSARSFSDAVDSLIRIRDAVGAYARRQAEHEHERVEAERAVEEERQRAARMVEIQKQAEAAWKERESARLVELENMLFPDGELDHVLIDGHNLVHRIFRPEDEARTRPWLEDLVVLMAKRLEETKGWSTVYHLVFDTQHDSNARVNAHGVRVYFANNTTEGGADARIAELLRDQAPNSHCMVVSTDRRHVWADADRLIAEEGRDIELVQIELLAEYLQVMDGLRKRG